MKIDGKELADQILQKLQNKVSGLKQKGITPTLAVILVGDNPGSESYVRQKQKMADSIHAEVKVTRYPQTANQAIINKTIEQYNNDSLIHGIILQLPLPPHFDLSINRSIDPTKDVDGFVPHSVFNVPVAMAVERILEEILRIKNKKSKIQITYKKWIEQQNIVIIGRGETAGKPIANYLKNKGCRISVIHSQTPEEEKHNQLKNADIIISCVGKRDVVRPDEIGTGVILISVGIRRDSEGKLHGDYEEEDIKDIASFYTPTPGGVGPLNVACLMENLVLAAKSAN